MSQGEEIRRNRLIKIIRLLKEGRIKLEIAAALEGPPCSIPVGIREIIEEIKKHEEIREESLNYKG